MEVETVREIILNRIDLLLLMYYRTCSRMELLKDNTNVICLTEYYSSHVLCLRKDHFNLGLSLPSIGSEMCGIVKWFD